MLYSAALFLHVLGALGLFVALGLEWTGVRQLRRATNAEQARERLAALAVLPRIYIPSTVAILVPGLYMTATTWGWDVGWTVVALAAMVLLAVVGATLTGLRMAPIGRAAATESGELSPALRQRLHDPVLWASIQIRAAIAVGIVFLMTVKPDLSGALLSIGVAVLIGLAATVPTWSRARTMDPTAPSHG